MRGVVRGRVQVVFQPAEERPFGQRSGAQAMLDDGLFAEGEPSAVLGLHCWPDMAAGEVGVDERIAMGAKDAFSIELRGRGAHAATPSRGRDAVLGLGALITQLHAGVSRALDATDRAAFNIGTVTGGRSQSVVADEALLTGTLRTVDPGVRSRLRAVIERVTAGVVAAHDLLADLRWADEMPPVLNDPRLVRRAMALAEDLRVPIRVLSDPPMTADDFALLAAGRPALYLKLGVGDPAADDWPPLHSSLFDVDDRCIGVGVHVLSGLAADLLDHGLDEAPVPDGSTT
jgi:amidohydrolase